MCTLLERIQPKRKLMLSREALHKLQAYQYPGNIRELRNILERASLMASGEIILPEHLLLDEAILQPVTISPFQEIMPLADVEQHYLRWAETHFYGDRKSLASALGIGERTLYRKLQRK